MTSTSFYPDGWESDDLMRGLMSTFKRREVNPDDFDTKMKFWTQAIEDSCFALGDPVVSIKVLSRRFRRKDRIPAGLETVLKEMLKKGDLQTKDDFLKGSQGWISWGFGVVTRPVSWVLGLNDALDISEAEFVLPALVKDQACKIVERHESCQEDSDGEDPMANGVVELAVLKRRVKDICPADRALDLALLHLQREETINIGRSRNGEQAGQHMYFSMQKTMEKLQNELVKLDQTAQQLDKEARLELRQGNKLKAKQVLRKKLLVLKKVKEKDAAYSNILSLMHKLAQTKEQRQILDAYKSGVTAFKKNLDSHGLSPEKVDETMEDIHETLNDHQDISMALSQGPSIGGNETDEDLENELKDLLEEEEPIRTKKIRLPDVPEDFDRDVVAEKTTPDRLKRLRLQLQS